ncbi:hypothetical protein BBK36DRAFT_1144258 [Trichoderma citrinoviride]|uniref:Uncharacterized protein n=1 Tax=Trichoderma citrinoviride TaxID=58853 RepID=A0A2T4B1K1_9HYPO|nr:hypothetical protein BBK36DRAFT_1144258 [Trichoderma citrinoviride]PTB63202.1 hypothetical protein BBK36DRAFT_1144258 [Trichoderma citrinoviride]
MLSLKSTIVLALGYASTVLAVEYNKDARPAIPVPCEGDELAISSPRTNSTAGTENASLEERQSCGWSGTFYEQSGCSASGSQFTQCTGGAGCVLTNSVLAFGFQSVKAFDTSCDLFIWNGDCSSGYSYYIPRNTASGVCWGGFGTGHGYSVGC